MILIVYLNKLSDNNVLVALKFDYYGKRTESVKVSLEILNSIDSFRKTEILLYWNNDHDSRLAN